MSVIYYRPQVLETIARQTLCKYDCGYLNQEPAAVPIEMIIENTFQLTIEYQYLTNNARELGRMIYDSGITTYYDQDLGDYALMRVQAAVRSARCLSAALFQSQFQAHIKLQPLHLLSFVGSAPFFSFLSSVNNGIVFSFAAFNSPFIT